MYDKIFNNILIILFISMGRETAQGIHPKVMP